jgi:hypothetical protein
MDKKKITPGSIVKIKPNQDKLDRTFPHNVEGKTGVVGKIIIEMGERLLIVKISTKYYEFFDDEVDLM